MSKDTIGYYSVCGTFVYESIVLYPDSTFKWTSEYDLKWSDYGLYEFKGDTLRLDYYLFALDTQEEDVKDSVLLKKNLHKSEYYIIEKGELYKLNKRGRKIKRKRDPSITTKYFWQRKHKVKYYKGMVDDIFK